MSDDLFSSTSPETSAFDDTRPGIDQTINYLEELVGEGKKFKSVEDLARGKAEADAFIKSLLREKNELVEEMKKRSTVDDLLAKLKETNGRDPNSMSNGNVNQHGGQPNGEGSNGSSAVNLDEIKAAVKADLEREAQEKQREANLAQVTDTLKSALGDNAVQVLQQKAQELGISLADLREMGAKSPKLLYATLGLGNGTAKKPDLFTPPSSVNTAGMGTSPQYGNHKPASYYQKLKQTNPKEYFSAKVSVQMHKDAIALGEKFFDT